MSGLGLTGKAGIVTGTAIGAVAQASPHVVDLVRRMVVRAVMTPRRRNTRLLRRHLFIRDCGVLRSDRLACRGCWLCRSFCGPARLFLCQLHGDRVFDASHAVGRILAEPLSV